MLITNLTVFRLCFHELYFSSIMCFEIYWFVVHLIINWLFILWFMKRTQNILYVISPLLLATSLTIMVLIAWCKNCYCAPPFYSVFCFSHPVFTVTELQYFIPPSLVWLSSRSFSMSQPSLHYYLSPPVTVPSYNTPCVLSQAIPFSIH